MVLLKIKHFVNPIFITYASYICFCFVFNILYLIKWKVFLTSLWQPLLLHLILEKTIKTSSEETASADSSVITKPQQNNSAPKPIVKIART